MCVCGKIPANSLHHGILENPPATCRPLLQNQLTEWDKQLPIIDRCNKNDGNRTTECRMNKFLIEEKAMDCAATKAPGGVADSHGDDVDSSAFSLFHHQNSWVESS